MSRLVLKFGNGSENPSVSEATTILPVPAPVLHGPDELVLEGLIGKPAVSENAVVFDSGNEIFGWLRGRPKVGLESSVSDLYARIFQLLKNRSLYRCWHFVPRINLEEEGLENYRRFCRARVEAFQQTFGGSWESHLPAASAVGTEEGRPVIFFAGGTANPERAENPEQVPAYRYPEVYGPKPPGFVRANRVSSFGKRLTFISGTASIKRSETIFPGDCEKQTEVTLDNLRLISRAVELGGDLGRGCAKRLFFVYLRRETDLPLVKQLLEKQLLVPGDDVFYLLAEICRSDLLVEIEATVVADAR